MKVIRRPVDPESCGTSAPTQNPEWHPSPFLKLSGLLHSGALASAAFSPDTWPWAAGAILANQCAIASAGLWPRSVLLGTNWNRLPLASAQRGEVAITFDDGPDPDVTPLVLDILDAFKVPASFFCIGARALRYPELCREIVARGHCVENHSFGHDLAFAFSGYRSFFEELTRAQEALITCSGDQPAFFRAPYGFRSVLLEPALSQIGLTLASWTRRGFDTRTRKPHRVLDRLIYDLKGGDILLLHDGNASRTASGEPLVTQVLPRLLEAIHGSGLRPVTLRAALT